MVVFTITYVNFHGVRVDCEFRSITELSEFMQELVLRGAGFTVNYNV